MLDTTIPHSDLTHTVIGCAMTVHNTLLSGYQEVIYQRALAIEMAEKNLVFEREKELDIIYKGLVIGSRRVDFYLIGLIPVEIKALTKLEDVHLAQTMNYLEVFDCPIGLLLNFGAPKLEFHRLVNKKHPLMKKV